LEFFAADLIPSEIFFGAGIAWRARMPRQRTDSALFFWADQGQPVVLGPSPSEMGPPSAAGVPVLFDDAFVLVSPRGGVAVKTTPAQPSLDPPALPLTGWQHLRATPFEQPPCDANDVREYVESRALVGVRWASQKPELELLKFSLRVGQGTSCLRHAALDSGRGTVAVSLRRGAVTAPPAAAGAVICEPEP
jgi:hypothetical protein